MDDADRLKREYTREELGEGVRGKYFQSFKSRTNVVLLDPDVAEAFPNAQAVNDALRKIIRSSENQAD